MLLGRGQLTKDKHVDTQVRQVVVAECRGDDGPPAALGNVLPGECVVVVHVLDAPALRHVVGV